MFILCLYAVLFTRHALAQLFEALYYKPKVVGSIPHGVIGIFNLHNPSGHTVALGLTQPLTKMRGITWGLEWLVHRPDNLTNFMC
jgi:hypothetical protein